MSSTASPWQSRPRRASTNAWKAIIPDFESKYGAKVEIQEDAYTNIQPKQFAEAQAHTGAYDLIGLQSFDLGKYVIGGVLTDLNPYFNNKDLADPNYDLEDFVEPLRVHYGEYEIEGKTGLYALPHKFDLYMAIYRPDLFKAAGLQEPATVPYDDLIAAAER